MLRRILLILTVLPFTITGAAAEPEFNLLKPHDTTISPEHSQKFWFEVESEEQGEIILYLKNRSIKKWNHSGKLEMYNLEKEFENGNYSWHVEFKTGEDRYISNTQRFRIKDDLIRTSLDYLSETRELRYYIDTNGNSGSYSIQLNDETLKTGKITGEPLTSTTKFEPKEGNNILQIKVETGSNTHKSEKLEVEVRNDRIVEVQTEGTDKTPDKIKVDAPNRNSTTKLLKDRLGQIMNSKYSYLLIGIITGFLIKTRSTGIKEQLQKHLN